MAEVRWRIGANSIRRSSIKLAIDRGEACAREAIADIRRLAFGDVSTVTG